MYVPTGLVHQGELRRVIDDAIGHLNPKVVTHVAYEIGNDTTDEPVLHFRITLTDAASRVDTLEEVTDGVETTLSGLIRPLENWGLPAYFSYRSESEQKQLNDPDWT